jgi:hypothetical protein
VLASRLSALLIAATAGCIALQPLRAHAQWWSHAPADFEECADAAEKAATKEQRTSALTQCNAKFAGRRKPGGGYTYYDFMQNRSFDIAGPNPTPEEQKRIDQQYTEFLDQERRNNIAAAVAAKQHQQQQQQQLQVQQATFRNNETRNSETRNSETKSSAEKVPLPVQAPNKQQVAVANAKARAKAAHCAQQSYSFSCEWPRLSESINDLKKKLFGSSASKDKRG